MNQSLIEEAKKAREKAYVPYSQFKVGAAILTIDDKIFTGCNIENVSLGLTVCAEVTALVKAVSEGFKSFKELVTIADSEAVCPPCGRCRQMLYEFSPDMKIIMVTVKGKKEETLLKEILPKAFDFRS